MCAVRHAPVVEAVANAGSLAGVGELTNDVNLDGALTKRGVRVQRAVGQVHLQKRHVNSD